MDKTKQPAVPVTAVPVTAVPVMAATVPTRAGRKLRAAIDCYFKDCEGLLAADPETGLPIPSKAGFGGYLYEKPPHQPTITGLALALGMSGRQELLHYPEEDKLFPLLKRAISRVEENAERRLLESGVGGAKFFLAGNFEGWVDGDNDGDSGLENKNSVFSGISTAELKKYLLKE